MDLVIFLGGKLSGRGAKIDLSGDFSSTRKISHRWDLQRHTFNI